MKKIKISILGMGYVGLPLAYEFGNYFNTIGFDISKKKIFNLKNNFNHYRIFDRKKKHKKNRLYLSSDENDLKESDFFILCLPTPIDNYKKPDLKILISGIRLVSKYLKKKSIVIIESTVYPGVTEEICLPELIKRTNLIYKKDFNIGFSPERINPGENTKHLKDIDKVVSGDTEKVAIRIRKLYEKIIKRVHVASNIKVAETAKIIENTQRDINIALINELALICKKLKINVYDVLKMAKTKWNFLDFRPGLVGGHCIGVDPYYLAYKAKKIGYVPRVIMAGRQINDKMPSILTKELIKHSKNLKITDKIKILIFGLTFKKNCADIRNSKIFEVIYKLDKKTFEVDYHDNFLIEEELDHKLKKRINRVNSTDKIKKKYNFIIMNSCHDYFEKISDQLFKKITYRDSIIFDLGNFFDVNQKKKINRNFMVL